MILFWSLMFISFCAINFLVIWLDDICPTEHTLKVKHKLALMSAVSNVDHICYKIKREIFDMQFISHRGITIDCDTSQFDGMLSGINKSFNGIPEHQATIID